MINEKLLKQKIFEKSILENKIIKEHKKRLKCVYMIRELTYDLILLEDEIKELQNE